MSHDDEPVAFRVPALSGMRAAVPVLRGGGVESPDPGRASLRAGGGR
ncbi:hypothetical protein FB559_2433 [Actinoallomurus bryophytorum]|uniref:Uncharacterized protein n=1 Tax=Actinoallomurus bryophytorum TaxID=1490222 RepID=A0A543CIL9_9ACTN|nr:hypothetical protein [Actinoallomurus bryophytorum]TQL96880.1 hypothetical protein FB559_2433 [Actinoallomurus bryophytorum]